MQQQVEGKKSRWVSILTIWVPIVAGIVAAGGGTATTIIEIQASKLAIKESKVKEEEHAYIIEQYDEQLAVLFKRVDELSSEVDALKAQTEGVLFLNKKPTLNLSKKPTLNRSDIGQMRQEQQQQVKE